MTLVAEVMTTDVRTLVPTDTVERLRDVLYLHGIGSVPIIDDRGNLVGIVTTTDLVEDWEPDRLVGTLMNEDVVTVNRFTSVATAARLMREQGIHHLVVTDDLDAVAGIVSSWDLLDAMADIIDEAVADTVPIHTVAPGDGLVIREPGSPTGRTATIEEVHGAHGLPPYSVSWDDARGDQRTLIDVIHRGDIALDGCER